MKSDSYSSYEKSIRDYRVNPMFKSRCKRRRSVITESSENASAKEATTTNQIIQNRKSPKKKINHVRGRKRFRHVAPNPVSGKHHEESASSSSKQSSVEEVTTTNPRNKNVNHPRGRNRVRLPVPKPTSGNPHEKKRKQKLVSASQNRRQPVPIKDVTREDVTREIMQKYRLEPKKGWKQRVEEWLGTQTDKTSLSNATGKEHGKERQEAENLSDQVIKQLTKQKSDKLRKEKEIAFKIAKTPTSSGVQGKKRKHHPSPTNKMKREKTAVGSNSKKEEKVQIKRRKKVGPDPSAAIGNYDVAAGEKTCGKCELEKKIMQQKFKILQEKQKLSEIIMKSKSPGWSVWQAISLIEAKNKQATFKLIHYVLTKKLNRNFVTKEKLEKLLKIMLEKNIIFSEKVKDTITFSSKVVIFDQQLQKTKFS